MGFWFFMLSMDLLTPLIMIIFGKIFVKTAPKEINAVFGYRTDMSMKNKDTWKFAHQYCGRLWLVLGAIMFVLSVGGMCFVIGKTEEAIAIVSGILCVMQIILLICSLIPTEIALRKEFDKDGQRK